MSFFGRFFSFTGGWRPSRVTVIPDGDDQARSSAFDGQTFVLGRGDSTWVDGKPVLTIDDDRVTFKNKGEASTTGDTATVDIQGDRGTVKNFHGARITAEDTAVEISGRGAFIHNRGTIDGGINGVNFANGGESSGTLRNYGTVSSDSRAVNIGGDGIQVQNYGKILGTGDQRNGTIYSDATADNFSISNYRYGVIDAGEGNQGAGIALQLGSRTDADIYNSGLIQGRGQAAADTGLAGDGIRLFSGVEGESTFRGDITNHGRILSESGVGPTAAVRVANGVGFDGTITNGSHGVIHGVNNGLYFGTGEHDARVKNFGTISSDSRAVNIDGTGVDIHNYGRIVGTGDQRNGTIYSDATADEFSINNYRFGVVDAGDGNQGAGIALQLGTEVEADIYNSGLIQGRGQADPASGLAGDGIRLFSGVEGESTFEGDITNHGRIQSESGVGPTAGVRVANGVGFDGTITNGSHGVISGVNNGLYFGTGDHDANVKNYGTISSDSRAVNIDGTGVDLHNYGRIVGTGDQRNGTIYSDATADDFSINNYRHGLVDAGDGNQGAGIALQLGSEVDADIYNSGLIQGRGQADATSGLAGDGIRLFSGVEGPSTFDGDITNHGRIQSESAVGPTAGVRIANGVGFDGTITNGRHGVISGVNNGLYFGTGEHDADVYNYGLISSDSRAVNIDGSGVDFQNYGKVLGTGDQRNGTIYSDATAEDFTIVNHRFGLVDAGDGNRGTGISLQIGDEADDVVEADVTNYGTIRGRGEQQGNNQDGDGIRVSSGVSDGITTLQGDVRNYGLIEADDDGIEFDVGGVAFIGDVVNYGHIRADGEGIFLDSGVTFTGDIENRGTIRVGDDGIDLNPGVNLTGDIVNRGTIKADDDGIDLDISASITGDIENRHRVEADDNGIEIGDITAFDGRIVNKGTITGDADGDGDGLAIEASLAQVDLHVVNEGTLNGDVLLGSGNDTFDGADGRVNGEINGGGGDDNLTGGQNADTFVFEQGTDRDSVFEFQLNRDRLDVSDFGFGDVNEFLDNAEDVNGDAVITLNEDGTDQIVLVGIDVNQLDANEFVI